MAFSNDNMASAAQLHCPQLGLIEPAGNVATIRILLLVNEKAYQPMQPIYALCYILAKLHLSTTLDRQL